MRVQFNLALKLVSYMNSKIYMLWKPKFHPGGLYLISSLEVSHFLQSGKFLMSYDPEMIGLSARPNVEEIRRGRAIFRRDLFD